MAGRALIRLSAALIFLSIVSNVAAQANQGSERVGTVKKAAIEIRNSYTEESSSSRIDGDVCGSINTKILNILGEAGLTAFGTVSEENMEMYRNAAPSQFTGV